MGVKGGGVWGGVRGVGDRKLRNGAFPVLFCSHSRTVTFVELFQWRKKERHKDTHPLIKEAFLAALYCTVIAWCLFF